MSDDLAQRPVVPVASEFPRSGPQSRHGRANEPRTLLQPITRVLLDEQEGHPLQHARRYAEPGDLRSRGEFPRRQFPESLRRRPTVDTCHRLDVAGLVEHFARPFKQTVHAVAEGPNHKALREWVHEHPERVDKRLRDVDSETEVELLSGDRVDVVYRSKGEIVAIEVKSRDSDWADLQRGIYQCVKYRAVIEAQEKEKKSGLRVRTLLVTESLLPVGLAQTAKRLDIPHLRVTPGGR